MKSKMAFLGVFVILVLGAAATPADISGKWYAPMEGVDGEMVFKVDGGVDRIGLRGRNNLYSSD